MEKVLRAIAFFGKVLGSLCTIGAGLCAVVGVTWTVDYMCGKMWNNKK